jgi:hypothetical protein
MVFHHGELHQQLGKDPEREMSFEDFALRFILRLQENVFLHSAFDHC